MIVRNWIEKQLTPLISPSYDTPTSMPSSDSSRTFASLHIYRTGRCSTSLWICLQWFGKRGKISFEKSIKTRKSEPTCWPRTVGSGERYPWSLRWWRARDCNWQKLIERLNNENYHSEHNVWSAQKISKKKSSRNDWHGWMDAERQSLLCVIGDLEKKPFGETSKWNFWVGRTIEIAICLFVRRFSKEIQSARRYKKKVEKTNKTKTLPWYKKLYDGLRAVPIHWISDNWQNNSFYRRCYFSVFKQ